MKYKPDFQNLAAVNSGFDSRDPSPHLGNLLFFQYNLFANILDPVHNNETGDEVIEELERQLAFFKAFRCGVRG